MGGCRVVYSMSTQFGSLGSDVSTLFVMAYIHSLDGPMPS